ncbi:MAG: carboxymuconolactone decarboxylase family protein [Deltaproteobacteria bacterium]|nr:carboxymuconolactone decarboxylase family protein [Deltaproteobacteria bacterium]
MTDLLTRKDVEKDIKDLFGFVPEFYTALPDAAIGALWGIQKELELKETVLDNKSKELVGLAMASHIKCKYCIYFHTRAAELFGARPQEIREAIAMGGVTALFSNVISGTQVDFDRFKRDVDRAVEHLSAKKR